MGSKMSFGRGSTDQNIVSELTSVGPRSSIHESSVQDPKDKWSAGKDLGSSCGEEMKATQMSQAVMESHPTEHRSPDCYVNCETGGGANCAQGEQHTLLPVATEAKPRLTSAAAFSSTGHGNPLKVLRRPGRPRKTKLDPADSDAVQRKRVSANPPLPTSLENHDSDASPTVMDDRLMNNSCLKEASSPHAVSEHKEPSTLPRRKRGRPKKNLAALSKPTCGAVAPGDPATPRLPSVCHPTRSPRNKEQQDLETAEGNADSQQTTLASSAENSNTTNFLSVKRRSCRLQANQPVPADTSNSADVPEAFSSCSNADFAITTESERPVEPNDSELAGAERDDDQHFTQAGAEKEPANVAASLQTVLPSPSEPEASPLEGGDAVGKNNEEPQSQTDDSRDSLQEAESTKAEPLSTGKMSPPEDTQKSCEVPLAVKDEDEEIEVDSFDHGVQLKGPGQFQNCANDTVKSESFTTQLSLFRRKRGGKRRRKVIKNVEVPYVAKEDLIAKEEPVPTEEGSCDGKQQAGCDDAKQRGDTELHADAIYIRKGGKTLMKCRFCERIFKFQSQFIIHVRIHTGERPFKCQECGKGFSKNSNLNLHLKTHSRNKMYQSCPFCHIKFSITEYAAHMEMHTQELVQDRKKINKPERRSRGSNGQDVQKACLSEKRERKVCQYCSKSFQFQSALVRHIRVHTGEKPYKCDICGKAFGQAYFLRVHELTHWSVKRYNCTRCEKSFTHYSNAKNHTCRPVGGDDELHPSRLGKPSLTYTCHICKSIFDHLQEFNSHMRDHKGAKLYRCLYCDKLFGVLSEFTAHHRQCKVERNPANSDIKEEETMSLIQYTVPALRCTAGTNSVSVAAANCAAQKKRSHSCSTKRSANANKPFQSTVIPAHPLSHLVSKLNKLDSRSDPRKYLCPGCGRLFRHMGRLRAHMLTHSPDRSYTCACCGKILANWKKLWRHQRVHRQRQGRFTCPQCGQGFRFVGPYKKHMRKHPEFQWVQVRPKKISLPYQCEQCRCSFTSLDLLFSHQLHHSSAQDTIKEFDPNLSTDDQSTQLCTVLPSKVILNPPPNNNSTVFCTVHKDKTTHVNALAQHPAPAAPPSSVTPIISFVQSQYLTSANPSGHPNRICSIQDRRESNESTNENAPITPLRAVKRHMTLNVSKSNEGPSDGVQCAVCGEAYSAISELYQHYLQHARGQV